MFEKLVLELNEKIATHFYYRAEIVLNIKKSQNSIE